MATFLGRRFFRGQFLKRVFDSKRYTIMHICTKSNEEFTSVLLNNRGHIEVFGDDSVKFLQGLLTNDVNLFYCDSQMTALYSMVLNTKGRVLYDLILYKQERETPGFLIECDLHAVKSILKTFKPYKLRSKVAFDDATDKFNSWAVIEEGSITGLKPIHKDLDFVTLADDPRITLLGARLVLPIDKGAAECFSNVKEISDQAVYDRHRLELGVAEGVKDLEPGKMLPLESNIDELHGVSFQKGCYIGQELTARTYHTGVIRKRLMPLKLMQTSNEECLNIDKDTAIVSTDGKRAGKVISVYGQLGLGLMRLDIVKSDNNLKIALPDGKEICVTVDWPTWWKLESQSI